MNMYIASMSGVNSAVQFITLILVFIIVLLITYYTTKFIGTYQKKADLGTNIEIIETHRISNTKYIQIVRIGKKYVVLAVCKDSITSITEINEEDVIIPDYTKKVQPFDQIFAKLKEMKSNKANPDQEDKENCNEDNK